MDGCDIIKAPMLQKRKQQMDSVQLVQSVRSHLWAQEKKENASKGLDTANEEHHKEPCKTKRKC